MCPDKIALITIRDMATSETLSCYTLKKHPAEKPDCSASKSFSHVLLGSSSPSSPMSTDIPSGDARGDVPRVHAGTGRISPAEDFPIPPAKSTRCGS